MLLLFICLNENNDWFFIALKSSKECLLHYLVYRHINFPIFTKFKLNMSPRYFSVNQIPNSSAGLLGICYV